MELFFHKKFQKQLAKLPVKTQHRAAEQLRVFVRDPFDPTLNNHALTGPLQNYRSINVTGDIRMWYEVVNDSVLFLKVGSHSDLY